MSDYPSAYPPAPPPPPGGQWPAPARGERPKSVTNAVYLLIAQVVISALGIIVLFATRDDYEDELRKNSSNLTDSEIHTAFTISIVVGIVFLVLWALLVQQVARGKNWARITTLVLIALGVVFGLVSLGRSEPALTRGLGIIGLLLDVAIFVLLVRGEASRWFKQPH